MPALLVALVIASAPATAQGTTTDDPERPASDATVTVPVLVKARGGDAPASVRPGEVSLSADGNPTDAELDAPADRRVTVYVDAALTGKGSIQRVANRLVDVLDDLLLEAELEIVVADPGVRTILPATRRPETARNALNRVFLTLEPEDAVETLRRSFEATAGAQSTTDEDRRTARLEAARLETEMLRRQFDQLLLWLGERRPEQGSDRVLLLVNETLGLDPLDFYSRGASEEEQRELVRATSHRPRLGDLAAVATASGWGVATLVRPEDGDGGLEYAPDEDTPVGFRLRFGGTGDEEPAVAEPTRLLLPDRDARVRLAGATGGAVLGADTGRRRATAGEDLIGLLRSRFLAELPSDRAGATLSASASRSSWTVRTLDRVPSPAPRELAAARLRSTFVDGGGSGDDELAIDAALVLGTVAGERDAAELRLDLTDLALPPGSPLRVSIAVRTQEDEGSGVSIQHYERELAPLDPGEDAAPSDGDVDPARDRTTLAPARIERIPLRLPPAADSVAVVVADVRTGRWGLAFADLASAASDAEDAGGDEPEPAISLVPMGPEQVTGRVRLRTRTTEDVARVVFYLNGKRVGRRSRAPFDAEIDVGERARTSQVVVAAYDRDGVELGRDRMLINEPPQSFWLRIVEPDPQERLAGSVEVEAELRIPAGAELDAVEFYWKDRLLESADEPPYRRTVRIPLNEPEGFLRVAARLDDGRIAEDVLVASQAAFGDVIGVELVELYVVATDRSGKPVRGLEESDFTVIEDGQRQTLESFEAAGDLPLTLGLAIDTSSSLFLKMPEVRSAARNFVRSLRDGRDRAFLLGFGSTPEMIRGVTGDLGGVERAIRSLEPYGATAVWGAINLGLEQLESIGGRRALVVFYDGDDEDPQRAFSRSLRMARRARLPVYLIVLNDEAARTSGRSLSSRSFANRLERISRVGGGRVYFVGNDDELDPIFESISEELRSHYLLTYYPELEPGGPLWRPVEVEVDRRGIDARTVEGRELELKP